MRISLIYLVAAVLVAVTLRAQTPSGSDATPMLVVLKDQPAKRILAQLAARRGGTRSPDERDLRSLARQPGGPDQLKIDAGQRVLTARQAEFARATTEIQAAVALQQSALTGRLIGLGATGIRPYTALNMLEATISPSARDVLSQDDAIAELVPVGLHQQLLDGIERTLNGSAGLIVPLLEGAGGEDAFARLMDRIIADRGALIAAASTAGTWNTLPVADYSPVSLSRLAAFAHLPVRGAQLNGAQPNPMSDSLSAATPFHLYKGRAQSSLQSTLVWDRQFAQGLQPRLGNLTLSVYGQADGAQIASSEQLNVNSQQVAITAGGEFVVKVKLPSALEEQPYGLALSEQGFELAAGPKLSVTCSKSCTVSNRGDLAALAVTATAGGADYPLGTIGAGSSVAFTPLIANPAVTAISQSYGETFSAAAADPCSGTWTFSTPDHLDAAGDNTVTVAVAPPNPACTWIASGGPATNFLATLTNQPITGSGSAMVVAKVPNTSPNSRTGPIYLNTPDGLLHLGPPYAQFQVTQDGTSTSRAPSIANLVPNGGESYAKGSAQAISWTYDAGSPARSTATGTVQLLKSGAVVATLSTSVALTAQSLPWTVPTNVTAGVDFQIRISSSDPSTKGDQSASNFQIADPSSLTIGKPDAGDRIVVGNPLVVTWSYSGKAGVTGKFELLFNGALVNLAGMPAAQALDAKSKTISVPVPANFDANLAGYTVRITPSDTSIAAVSSGTFAIDPKLAIAQPAGNPTWLVPSAHKITVTGTGLLVKVYVRNNQTNQDITVTDSSVVDKNGLSLDFPPASAGAIASGNYTVHAEQIGSGSTQSATAAVKLLAQVQFKASGHIVTDQPGTTWVFFIDLTGCTVTVQASGKTVGTASCDNGAHSWELDKLDRYDDYGNDITYTATVKHPHYSFVSASKQFKATAGAVDFVLNSVKRAVKVLGDNGQPVPEAIVHFRQSAAGADVGEAIAANGVWEGWTPQGENTILVDTQGLWDDAQNPVWFPTVPPGRQLWPNLNTNPAFQGLAFSGSGTIVLNLASLGPNPTAAQITQAWAAALTVKITFRSSSGGALPITPVLLPDAAKHRIQWTAYGFHGNGQNFAHAEFVPANDQYLILNADQAIPKGGAATPAFEVQLKK